MTNAHPHRIWPPATSHPPAVVGASVIPAPAPAGATRWAALQARDVMRTDLAAIDPYLPLSEVERILSEKGVSGAPVMDATGRVLGIVSMKDVMERYSQDHDARPRHGRVAEPFPLEDDVEAEDEPPLASVDRDAEETAADVMTADVHWVPADAGLGEIARTMVEHRIHRVLVKDSDRYVGLISTLDVVEALAG